MNSVAAKKIDELLNYQGHFTDFEFGGGFDRTGEKPPRPEKRDWLIDLFKDKMNRLKDFLDSNPDLQELDVFIEQELQSLDSSQFFQCEYELFVAKYGEVPYWMLNCKAADKYLKENRSKLHFADLKK